MFSKKIFLEIGIVDEGVDIVDGFFEVLLMEFEVKWSFLMEDCEEFVSQVNRKFQDWLVKVIVLLEREKMELSDNLMMYDSEGVKYDFFDFDESDYNKDKELK